MISLLKAKDRDEKGLVQVLPSNETYFGESMISQKLGRKIVELDYEHSEFQELAMELYETRIASMQRFVAMTVFFHELGSRVKNFFDHISFGMIGYRMDRTHSIMRIATTASPVSGADVRERMEMMQLINTVESSVVKIEHAWLSYKQKKMN